MKSFRGLNAAGRGASAGFTLMEILFVLLVIAVILSFAVPAFRSVRFDVKNSRALAAVKKLAEARRSFYQYSKGSDITSSSFKGSEANGFAGQSCTSAVSSGIPASSRPASAAAQLFACGFLNPKDFADLPYTFYVCPLNSVSLPCKDASSGGSVFAAAKATSSSEAGAKYAASGYYMYVGADMKAKDTLE